MALIELPSRPQRVLIIKPSAIGDVVHALPVWDLLRRHWPEARFSWVVTPGCAGLLEGHHDLELIRFDRRRWATAWYNPMAAYELFRFGRELQRRRFDVVIDLQGLLRSAWMAWWTRAAVRIGFDNAREWGWVFYTHRVPVKTMEQHAIDRYLKIAAALGCATEPVAFPLAVSDADRQWVAAKLSGEKAYAVILPGSNWVTKRWPAESFGQLVGPLRDRFGLESVVAGGADDVELGSQMPGAMNLAGQTTLGQLMALLERAAVVIANDSGPMHMAVALGRPLVAVFGPTNPIRTGPYGRQESVVRANISCSPCYKRRCSHMKCMGQLGVEAVLAAVARGLGESKVSAGARREA